MKVAWRMRGVCLRDAWSVLGGSPGRIDTQAPGPVVHTLLIPRSHTPDDLRSVDNNNNKKKKKKKNSNNSNNNKKNKNNVYYHYYYYH